MMFWIMVTSGAFVLTIALGDYFKTKKARENRLKKIAKRLKQIEQSETQEDNNKN
ncbi:MAG: hypothetical protein ACI9FR_001454 [Cryomorphaceae bacterium]|jgi:hypothetical protein